MGPLKDLIEANPTPATLHTPAARATYDPHAVNKALTTPTTDRPVIGLFSNVVQQGLDVAYVATLSLAVEDLSASEAKAGELTVTVNDTAYQVKTVRKRFFAGVQSGWTLVLS